MYGGPGGAPPVQPYQVNKERRTQFGVVGAVIAGIGAIARRHRLHRARVVHFRDRRRSEVQRCFRFVGTRRRGRDRVATAYFGWLGWVLLAVGAIAAIAGNLPTSASGAARALGALVGLAGVGVTFWAIKFVHDDDSYTEFLKRADIGFYVAAGGFLLIAIGALMGPTSTPLSQRFDSAAASATSAPEMPSMNSTVSR